MTGSTRSTLRTLASQPWWEGGWKAPLGLAVLVAGVGVLVVGFALPMPDALVAILIGVAAIMLGVFALRLRWREVTRNSD